MKKNTIWQSRQLMTKNNFEIFHYYDNYVKEVKLHHHDFYEIYYFINGNVVYTIEGRTYKLNPGNILIISPNELHQVIIPSEDSYERIVFWISKKYLTDLSTDNTDLTKIFSVTSESKNNLLELSNFESKKIFNYLEQIASTHNSPAFGDDLICQSKIIELLICINGVNITNTSPILEKNIIQNVIEYVNNNLENINLSIEEISNKYFISPSRLSHIFKEAIGTSLYQYIIKKRLIKSKELLQTGLSVVEIYKECGFKDYMGFFRTFKKEYNITPKEYYRSLLS